VLPTETYFGRQLTKEIVLLGGGKKRTPGTPPSTAA
jgi:hypothetical protein